MSLFCVTGGALETLREQCITILLSMQEINPLSEDGGN